MLTELELELKSEPLFDTLPIASRSCEGLPRLGVSGKEWPLRLVIHRSERGSWFNVGDRNYRASLIVTIPGSLVGALNCHPSPWQFSFSK